jgi:hypothetical protein
MPPELIPGAVSLQTVPGLTEAQIRGLTERWITSAQDLVGLAGYYQNRTRLADQLGVDRAALDRLISAAQRLMPPVRSMSASQQALMVLASPRASGARVDEPADELLRRRALPPYSPDGSSTGSNLPAPGTPDQLLLLDNESPQRDQGTRSTCVVFAALGVREHLERAAGAAATLDLSEEYVYWWCKKHDQRTDLEGTYLRSAFACLEQSGAPPETTFPYVPDEKDEAIVAPPDVAASQAGAYRIERTVELNPADIEGAKMRLRAGKPLAVAFPLFNSWYQSTACQRYGKVILPLWDEDPIGGHALGLVGYQDDPEAPGGGYFVGRNAWPGWAFDNAIRPGYALLPYAFVSRYATDLVSAERLASAALIVHDSPLDEGDRPLPNPVWQSPDLWIRQNADGGLEGQQPVTARANAVYGRVTNTGTSPAYRVQLAILAAPLAPFVRPTLWQPVGQVEAAQIDPGAAVVFEPVMWDVPQKSDGGSEWAMQARVSCPADPIGLVNDPVANDNVAEKHEIWVRLTPGNAVDVPIAVWPARGVPGTLRIEVDRATLPDDVAAAPAEWTDITPLKPKPGLAETVAEVAEILGGMIRRPAEFRTARLNLALAPTAEPGIRRIVGVNQLQGQSLVGRLTIQIIAE